MFYCVYLFGSAGCRCPVPVPFSRISACCAPFAASLFLSSFHSAVVAIERRQNLADARAQVEGAVRMQGARGGGDNDGTKPSSGISYREKLKLAQAKRGDSDNVVAG